MAFNLTITASSILQEGQKLQITENSVWTDSALGARNKYGVLIKGEYRLSDTPTVVEFDVYDPTINTIFLALSPANGRYSFTAYAFIQKGAAVPAVGDVQLDSADNLLYSWDGTVWTEVPFDSTSQALAAYSSTVLEVPLLSYAYAYRNILNLDYIEQVKYDTEHGAEQNKLYYKRTLLDYFYAMILSAEYNWTIDSYFNFYQLTINLNNMIKSGKIE